VGFLGFWGAKQKNPLEALKFEDIQNPNGTATTRCRLGQSRKMGTGENKSNG
jgi:hypothetical protein